MTTTYKPDVAAVTGLDLVEIETRIRRARMMGRTEPVSWPRDAAGLARDLLDGGDVAGFDNFAHRRHGEPSARERLAAALVSATEQRIAEGDDKLAAGWKATAAVVSAGRAAGNDAAADADRAVRRVETKLAEEMGAAAVVEQSR